MASGERPELRLGLVLYGGVSLAVYIYGVVVEVQRLLRASDALAERKASIDDESSAGYAEALRHGGLSRASVDIVAGTSAGGINGILLARALASGADLRDVKGLWLDSGDIGRLLHGLDDDDEPSSLIRSELFETRLCEGFETLTGDGSRQRSGDPLDLFVSATHLRGTLRTFPDSLSGEIPTLVHRRVFQLKRRPDYNRDDFRFLAGADGAPTPGSERAALTRLVKLARATSAFPVAFEPVRIDSGDALLGPTDEPCGWYADGGILNNKPFTEALETIFTRASDRPVRRWLLSVDPDPEKAIRPPPPGPKPGFDEVLIGAATGIPRYQSIAKDLEGLSEHNAAVRRVADLIVSREQELAALPSGAAVPATPEAYKRLRVEAWADLVADTLLERVQPVAAETFDAQTVRAAFAAAARSAIRDGEGIGASDMALERRRIYYLIKLIGLSAGPLRRIEREAPPDDDEAAPEGARVRLWEMFERVSRALWESLGSARLELADGAESSGLDQEAYAVAAEKIEAELGGLGERSGAIARATRAAIDGLSIDLPRRLGADADAATFSVDLADVFDAFELRDIALLTIDAGGGLRSLDIVNHAQISPATAMATRVAAKNKLAGDTLGHFGGFLDREWRENNLLWGRLDGAEILLRAILAESQADEAKRAELIDAVLVEILEDECPDALKAPRGDWRAYLKAHAKGRVSVEAIASARKVGLAYRAAVTLRRMLRATREEAEAERPAETRTAILRGAEKAIDGAGWLLLLPRLAFRPLLRRRASKTEPEDPKPPAA